MKIICQDPEGQAIVGCVEFLFRSGIPSKLEEIDGNGIAIATPQRGILPFLGVVKPTDGHWPTVAPLLENENYCTCPKMDLPWASTWWRELPFKGIPSQSKGDGVRIGVIDLPSRRPITMQHMKIFGIEGDELDEDSLPMTSHGLRVGSIIAERGSKPERKGIAPKVEVILIDVSDDFAKDSWDYSKIAPAIQILTDEFNVEIINISGGCSLKEDDSRLDAASLFFKEAVEYATDTGILVISSTGNDKKNAVAIPAQLECTIGVGAVGRCAVAPEHTRTFRYESAARNEPGCVGSLHDAEFFHYLDTSFGQGLDVVGPGIGIVMSFDDGSFVEYDGTSYAAPYVAGVIAASISENREYLQLNGADRHKWLKYHLFSLCVDLGIDRTRQGNGLPVIVG